MHTRTRTTLYYCVVQVATSVSLLQLVLLPFTTHSQLRPQGYKPYNSPPIRFSSEIVKYIIPVT